MKTSINFHIKLIESLGGSTQVSRMVSEEYDHISPQSVSAWKKRGVPTKYRYYLARKAHEQDLKVPKSFLMCYDA